MNRRRVALTRFGWRLRLAMGLLIDAAPAGAATADHEVVRGPLHVKV